MVIEHRATTKNEPRGSEGDETWDVRRLTPRMSVGANGGGDILQWHLDSARGTELVKGVDLWNMQGTLGYG